MTRELGTAWVMGNAVSASKVPFHALVNWKERMDTGHATSIATPLRMLDATCGVLNGGSWLGGRRNCAVIALDRPL